MRNIIILIYFLNFLILFFIINLSDTYYITDAIGNRIEYKLILLFIILFFLFTMISFFLIKRYHNFCSKYQLCLLFFFFFIVIFIFSCLIFFCLKISSFELDYKWNDKIILFKSIDNTYFINKIFTEQEKYVFTQLYWEHLNNSMNCHYILNDQNIENCINQNSLNDITEYLNIVYKQHLNIWLNESPHWGIKMPKKEILYYAWRSYYNYLFGVIFFGLVEILFNLHKI